MMNFTLRIAVTQEALGELREQSKREMFEVIEGDGSLIDLDIEFTPCLIPQIPRNKITGLVGRLMELKANWVSIDPSRPGEVEEYKALGEDESKTELLR
jgi:hypothetical protein